MYTFKRQLIASLSELMKHLIPAHNTVYKLNVALIFAHQWFLKKHLLLVMAMSV